MTKEEVRRKLIQAGINNLKEFGYEYVTAETILTDKVYSYFYKNMLEDNLGKKVNPMVDEVIHSLINEINTNLKGGEDE